MTPKPVTIAVDETRRVSGLLQHPRGARACYVLAHGAGAGMTHPFMTAIAGGLAGRGIATLRYQFPYMEQGGKRPDAPKLAQATVRAAVAQAAKLMPKLPLIAGGKSFGGRMTSQAQAEAPLPGVRGLAFLGFPLHAAGRPSEERAAHLFDVKVPMLFLQGIRDALADIALMRKLAKRSASALPSSPSKAAIIPSMRQHALAGTIPRQEPSCSTRSPVGSKICPRSKAAVQACSGRADMLRSERVTRGPDDG
jgi:predicted alpha/beta-hydrolase family hydrolase